MILHRSSQQQLAALRRCHRLSATTHLAPFKTHLLLHRRRIHHVPQLQHEDHFSQHGIGRMLSPSSYNLAWTQYQTHLVNQLNQMTAGTKDGDRSTKDLLLAYSRNPTKASLFNHASMAWNTHHTMTTLLPSPNSPNSSSSEPSPALSRRLKTCFSSMDSFKETFIATANAMFGPGFVWLVKNDNAREGMPANDPQLVILATYIAGSPLPGAHFRRQPTDMNTENPADPAYNPHSPSPPAGSSGSTNMLRSTAGAFGNSSGSFASKVGLGGAPLEVMLGVCTWPHFWLHDFGPSGKRDYLEAWWECIDWSVVERNGLFDEMRAREANLPRVGGGRRGG